MGSLKRPQSQPHSHGGAEVKRYLWLTQNPVVARAEEDLLRFLAEHARGRRMLEVGCGEGANLKTLQRLGALPQEYTGFDNVPAKIEFCRRQHRGQGEFLVADGGAAFPFAAAAFDLVLVRDVLHHVEAATRRAIVLESLRVLAEGGRLVIVEGNASNWLNRAFALLLPRERLMLETRAALLGRFLDELLDPSAVRIEHHMGEPSNLFRLLLHYRYGVPRLAHLPAVAAALNRWRRWGRRGANPRRWAYAVFQVIKT